MLFGVPLYKNSLFCIVRLFCRIQSEVTILVCKLSKNQNFELHNRVGRKNLFDLSADIFLCSNNFQLQILVRNRSEEKKKGWHHFN